MRAWVPQPFHKLLLERANEAGLTKCRHFVRRIEDVRQQSWHNYKEAREIKLRVWRWQPEMPLTAEETIIVKLRKARESIPEVELQLAALGPSAGGGVRS